MNTDARSTCSYCGGPGRHHRSELGCPVEVADRAGDDARFLERRSEIAREVSERRASLSAIRSARHLGALGRTSAPASGPVREANALLRAARPVVAVEATIEPLADHEHHEFLLVAARWGMFSS